MNTVRYACWAVGLAQCAAVLKAAVVISPATLPDWTLNVAYLQTLTASGCTTPCGWSSNGHLPTGLTLDSASGAISGVPRSAGSFQFTITASNLLQSSSQSYTIVINPQPRITTTALPAGQTGVAYLQAISVTGGTSPFAFSVTAGSLPAGLSLASASGMIIGTPNDTGAFSFSIQVTDSASSKAVQSYTLVINPQPALSISTSSPLPGGTVGAAYSSPVTASGGTPPYAWAVIGGALPGGLALSATGTLSGTPAAPGAFTFVIQVVDRAGATTSKQFALTIAASPQTLTILTTSLPAGSVGSAYSQMLVASGGVAPYSWAIVAGALPGRLTLSPNTGGLTGTPSGPGTFQFTVQVTDHVLQTAQQALSITISTSPGVPGLSLTGLSNTALSAKQVQFGLALSSTYPSTVTGQVSLSFQSTAAVPMDDPAIQFSGGGRTAGFTIPANTTLAVFSVSPIAFQTGTVAGIVTLAVTSNLPGGALTQTLTVMPAPPFIQGASIVMNASGFQIQVTGYSNSRELTGASFHFTAAPGQVVQTSDLTLSIAGPASQWYSSSASTSFGGQFLVVVPFSLQQGVASGLASVSVQLQNAQNTSPPVTANF